MELMIDDVPLVLGEEIDPGLLTGTVFHKVGLVRRILTGKPSHRVLFTAANAQLRCLADDFSIYPCLDSYLDDDRRWETRARLYVEEGRLHTVEFQVIDGRYAAGNFLERFADLCTATLGEPVVRSRRITTWHNGQTVVTGRLRSRGYEAEFRFEWNGKGAA